MKRTALVALALVACRHKPSPPSAADAGVTKVDIPDAAAAEEEAGSAVRSASPPPPLSLYARFARDTEVYLHPVNGGIAIFQLARKSGRGSVGTTTARDQAPRVLTSQLGNLSETRFIENVQGTTEMVLLRTSTGETLRAEAGKPLKTFPHRYSDIVEFRDGQWLGYSGARYELLAGAGALPKIPAAVHPEQAVHLVDGKMCAAVERGVWTTDAAGRQDILPLDRVRRVYRGQNGECWAVADGDQTLVQSIYRLSGDGVVGAPVVVDFNSMGMGEYSYDREGGVWFVGKKWIIRRVVVADGKATETHYPLPETMPQIDNCLHPTADHVVAKSPTDIWVVMMCRGEDMRFDISRMFLLHSSPPAEVFDWPSP